jgi:hypothetical protein
MDVDYSSDTEGSGDARGGWANIAEEKRRSLDSHGKLNKGYYSEPDMEHYANTTTSPGASQRRMDRGSTVENSRVSHFFEFVVLEQALENVCWYACTSLPRSHLLCFTTMCAHRGVGAWGGSLLAEQADELEEDAYPALDSLTAKVTSSKLERIRQVKARMTRLMTRVQQVQAELEHLLDNDDDMHEMYALPSPRVSSAASALALVHASSQRRVGLERRRSFVHVHGGGEAGT